MCDPPNVAEMNTGETLTAAMPLPPMLTGRAALTVGAGRGQSAIFRCNRSARFQRG